MIRNGLSFDVEDWFHVSNYDGTIHPDLWDLLELRVVTNTKRIVDILKSRNVHATFFVLGWLAERLPELVRLIAEQGHEIGTHGYTHRRLNDLGPDGFREDLQRSIRALKEAGAQDIRGFRAPSFSISESNHWAFDVISECGLQFDSSIFPTSLHPTYGIRDAPLAPYRVREGLWELPLGVLEVAGRRLPIGGGAYFRVFPFAFSRWAISRVNREGRPVVVYLHPWELDADQPPVRTAAWRRFRQRVNLQHTAERLTRLLDHFEFVPLSEIAEEYAV